MNSWFMRIIFNLTHYFCDWRVVVCSFTFYGLEVVRHDNVDLWLISRLLWPAALLRDRERVAILGNVATAILTFGEGVSITPTGAGASPDHITHNEFIVKQFSWIWNYPVSRYKIVQLQSHLKTLEITLDDSETSNIMQFLTILSYLPCLK